MRVICADEMLVDGGTRAVGGAETGRDKKVGFTVADAAGAYVRAQRRNGRFAASTATTYRSILGRFADAIGDPPMAKLQRRHVARWLDTLDCGPATTRHRLSVVQTFCRWAVEQGHVAKDPSVGFKPPKQPRHLPRPVAEPDTAALVDSLPDARAVAIVILMLQTGARCCEVVRLQVGDVDWHRRFVMFRGKGDKERVVPLPDEACIALRRYLAEHPAPAGPLFRSYTTGDSLTPGHIGALVRRWMREAGVKQAPRDGVDAHALRHTALTDMLHSGADVRQVQVIAGHDSLQTTQRYLGWHVEGLRSAMDGRRYMPHAELEAAV